MRCVVDASVAIKWFFQSAPDEADVDAAVALLSANRDGAVSGPTFRPVVRDGCG